MAWTTSRYLDVTLPTVAENLALDEALLLEAEESVGPTSLRVWELDHLAVVLGASGRIADDVRLEACEADGVPIARRSSGGGTVVIGPGALNVSVVLPIAADPEFKSVDRAQRLILGQIAEAIRREGPPVEVLGSGDLTLDGRKFSGSAQRRLRNHLLVHASLLYDFPIEMMGRYTRKPSRQPDYRRGRSHDDFLTNLSMSRQRLLDVLQGAWLAPGAEAVRAHVPETRVRGLVEAKFSDIGWIRRL